MVNIRAFFWIFVLFLAQNFLLYFFPAHAPALVLIGVLYYALSEGAPFGALAGLWGGWLLDLFSVGRPGFFTAAFSAAGFFGGTISSKIFQDSLVAEIVLPLASLYAVLLAQLWFLRTRAGEALTLSAFAEAFLFWPLLITAAVSPWVFARLRFRSARARRRP